MKHNPDWSTGRCRNCGEKLTPTNTFEECVKDRGKDD